MNLLGRLRLAYQAAVAGEAVMKKGLFTETNVLHGIATNLLGPDLINNHDQTIGWDEVKDSITSPSTPLH